MRKFLEVFSWTFLGLFAIPTFLIMGSWGSLPGETMYPVKLGLERVLLFMVKPSYSAEATLNVKYTQRRLAEANTLLAKDKSSKGLSYLSQQVVATKDVIRRAPNKAVQKQLAMQYVETLKTAQSELAQQKISLSQPTQTQASTFSIPTSVPPKVVSTTHQVQTGSGSNPPVVQPTTVRFVQPTTAPVQPSSANQTPAQEMSQEFSSAQNTLQTTIDELQQYANEPDDSGSSNSNGNGKNGNLNNGNSNNGNRGNSDNNGNRDNSGNNNRGNNGNH